MCKITDTGETTRYSVLETVGVWEMNTVGKRPIRVGMTEHVVRRFFDVTVMIVLTAFVGAIWWFQQPNQEDTTLALGGIDVDSIVTIANTDTVVIEQ